MYGVQMDHILVMRKMRNSRETQVAPHPSRWVDSFLGKTFYLTLGVNRKIIYITYLIIIFVIYFL